MKKNYFMLAAATMMFAACAETDLVNEITVEETQQAIGFDAFANKTTRAEITKTSDLQSNAGGFHVWGYKNRTGESEYTVFDNVPVSWVAPETTTDESTGVTTVTKAGYWTYSIPQYWDKTATYKFYAVAPKVPTDVTYSIDNYLVSIKGAKSGNSEEVVDYLIDRNGVTNVDGAKREKVAFEFNHVMAKLSFKFKSGVNSTDKINITALKMEGWNAQTGKFTQSEIIVPTSVDHTEWGFTNDTKINNPIDIVTSDNKVEDITSATAKAGGYSLIMVPQTITYVQAKPEVTNEDGTTTPAVAESGLKFTISYEIIKSTTDKEVFTEQVGILPTTQTWGTDTHTTYTIIVSPTKIEFGDPTIKNWSVTDNKAEESLPL